jgi:hypothetical protein
MSMSEFTRRDFLFGVGALASTSLLPRWAVALPAKSMVGEWFTEAENARRVERVLREPWVLTQAEASGGALTNLNLIVPGDFKRTFYAEAVVVPEGIKDLRVRNVNIVCETEPVWEPRWNQPLYAQPMVGISSYLSGISLRETVGADIDGLHIEGAPSYGIFGWGVSKMRVRRYSALRCFAAAQFSNRGIGNRLHVVERVRIWGQWGPYGFGGDGWVCEGYQLYFKDFCVSGPTVCGAKFCGPGTLWLEDFTAPSLMLQGRAAVDDGTAGLNIAVNGLYLNAGYSPESNVNRAQIAWGVTGGIDGGYIVGTGNGDAIQCTGDCHLDVRNILFAGNNGERGGLPAAALALDVGYPWPSTINADFETANRFENQIIKLRRAG